MLKFSLYLTLKAKMEGIVDFESVGNESVTVNTDNYMWILSFLLGYVSGKEML